MKTVRVLLKTGETATFPKAAVQEKDGGRVAIYDESYRIVVEFRACELEKWWYAQTGESVQEVSTENTPAYT